MLTALPHITLSTLRAAGQVAVRACLVVLQSLTRPPMHLYYAGIYSSHWSIFFPSAGAFHKRLGNILLRTGLFAPAAGVFAPEAGAFAPADGAFAPAAGVFAPEAGAFAPEAGAFAPVDGAIAPAGWSIKVKMEGK